MAVKTQSRGYGTKTGWENTKYPRPKTEPWEHHVESQLGVTYCKVTGEQSFANRVWLLKRAALKSKLAPV